MFIMKLFISSENDKPTEKTGADAESLKSQDDVIALKIGPEVVELKAGIVQKWKRGSYQFREIILNVIYSQVNFIFVTCSLLFFRF